MKEKITNALVQDYPRVGTLIKNPASESEKHKHHTQYFPPFKFHSALNFSSYAIVFAGANL